VLRERASIWVLEEEAHVRLSVATVLITSDGSALVGTFKQRQALPLHSLEGRSTAMIDHYGASIMCDFADNNLLVEVAHAIADPHFVKVDFPWKLTTHGPLMLAGSLGASPSSFVADRLARLGLDSEFPLGGYLTSALKRT
jgi:hypothetical protein